MKEVWKDVIRYKGLYAVSSFGRIKRKARTTMRSNGRALNLRDKVLKPNNIGEGYYQVKLTKDQKEKSLLLHRLLCRAFNGPAPKGKPHVNHLDGDKDNNRPSNLAWCSVGENNQHAYDTGLKKRGGDHWRAKLTEREMRYLSL